MVFYFSFVWIYVVVEDVVHKIGANGHADKASSVASLLALATVAFRRIFALSVVGNLCRRHRANMQSYCVTVGNN